MNNAELIKAARICANQTCCDNCPRYNIDHTQDAQRCCIQLINDAADALEAADKRIAELEKEHNKTVTEIFGEEQLWWENRCKELEAQLPKRGEWIDEQRGRWIYAKCNLCGKVQDVRSNYCPNCGAKMRKGDK